MPFDRRVGATRAVNAGSVGFPFGVPGASWALLGPDVELRRTRYDHAAVAERIRRIAYPTADADARTLLEPPAEAGMLELYGQHELTFMPSELKRA